MAEEFCEQLEEFLQSRRYDPEKLPVALMYHGTKHTSVQGIFENNFDIDRQGVQYYGRGIYMSLDPNVVSLYGRTDERTNRSDIIASAVILDPDNFTMSSNRPKEYVAIHNTKAILPLFHIQLTVDFPINFLVERPAQNGEAVVVTAEPNGAFDPGNASTRKRKGGKRGRRTRSHR